MKTFGGRVLFLGRSDINTDEIIPAKYLTEVDKKALKAHLLEDLTMPGFSYLAIAEHKPVVVITRANFGCGSSREHAPWAFEVNGIHVVIAQSYARIFRQNMFNCGMLAIELSSEKISSLFALENQGAVECSVNMEKKKLVCTNGAARVEHSFDLNPFDEALVRAGGWVDFADVRY